MTKRKKILCLLKIILFGHLLNFGSRIKRREKRQTVVGNVVTSYMERYLPKQNEIIEKKPVKDDKNEKIWALWLQGEENAPDLIKTCYKTIKKHCKQELVVLNENNLYDYIDLPDYIKEKRKKGYISGAHFSDIVRVELLYKFGGFWMDSTLYVTDKIPDYIVNEDFFIFLAGNVGGGSKYSFMQNCFIRSRKGSYLLSAWRNMILKYWKEHNHQMDYFMHQIIFKCLVLNDEKAKKYFETMPHVVQDPTHYLWWDYRDKPFDEKVFREKTKDAFFQKTTFKGNKYIPGSFSDILSKKVF